MSEKSLYNIKRVHGLHERLGLDKMTDLSYYCNRCGCLNNPFKYNNAKMTKLLESNTCDECTKEFNRKELV